MVVGKLLLKHQCSSYTHSRKVRCSVICHLILIIQVYSCTVRYMLVVIA